MVRLIQAFTRRGLVIAWMFMLAMLLYAGITGIYYQTMMPDRITTIVLLFFTFIMLIVESVWEGTRFRTMPSNVSDALGLFNAIVVFGAMMGFWLDIPIFVNIFGPMIGGIFLMSAGVLAWEGAYNLK